MLTGVSILSDKGSSMLTGVSILSDKGSEHTDWGQLASVEYIKKDSHICDGYIKMEKKLALTSSSHSMISSLWNIVKAIVQVLTTINQTIKLSHSSINYVKFPQSRSSSVISNYLTLL